MDYVNLGSTGLKVSRICLGTMTYGSKKWREWVLEEKESRPFIQRALEAGINFFDTADMYSVGVSEEIVGRALKDFGPARDRGEAQRRGNRPAGGALHPARDRRARVAEREMISSPCKRAHDAPHAA